MKVPPPYVEGQPHPEETHYVFSYTVTIRNMGTTTAQLISRHWLITDANGQVQEIKGPGVVGHQPYLEPGKAFRYTSGTVLETPVGFMKGSFQMVSDLGEFFDADIKTFSLSGPRTLH